MSTENVLVVVLEDGLERPLWNAMARRSDHARHVHVVAPMQVGSLQWLATDEDGAREDAEVRAVHAESAIAVADVDAETGDPDPVLAVEDALRIFPADEILLVADSTADGEVEDSLRQFGLPVSRVPRAPRIGRRSSVREFLLAVAAGRSQATPFVLLVAVALFLVGLSALVVLTVVLLAGIL
jgi:hypothetical protein